MSGNKILLVMRHAKSSWKTSEPDPRRPLSGRGTRDAVVAGQTLVQFSPDVVLCSSATRARQTWKCAEMGGASCSDVRFLDELYAASGDEMLDLVQTVPAECRTVLVIGHEPGVSDLVLDLAVASKLSADIESRFPTSAIAVLTHARSWADLAPATANLVAFKTPRG